MTNSLPAVIRHHIHHHVTAVVVEDLLTEHQGGELHTLIMGCVGECPVAVLIDLTAVAEVSPAVLAAIAEAGAAVPPDTPPVAVFVCGVQTEGHDALAPHASVFDSPEQAHQAALTLHRTRPRTEFPFDASIDAPGQVRRLVADTCRRWSLDHVQADATLIMSELVSNVVRHTPGSGVAALTHRHPFLQLEVEDRDPTPPTTRSTDPYHADGRGLAIIEALGARWGCRVGHDDLGKIVWASVPTHLTNDLRAVNGTGRPPS
jgi:anti-sigma regulatory factor (Ser/Thr protein kinase)